MDDETLTFTDPMAGPSRPPFDRLGAARHRPTSAAAETFRTLAMTVDRIMTDSRLASLAVVSARRGDGRSLTAELLAIALSEVGPPVRLVDADPLGTSPLRAPGRRGRRGRASSSVEGDGPPPEFLGEGPLAFDRLDLKGEAVGDSRALVDQVRAEVVARTREGHRVIVDVPAFEAGSLGFALAREVDGAIYVARVGRLEAAVHAQVRAQCDLLGVDVIGVVINRG